MSTLLGIGLRSRNLGFLLIASSGLLLIGEGEWSSVERAGVLLVVSLGGLMMIEEIYALDGEYILLILIGILGMVILITSKTLLVMYIGVEIQSLVFYVLIGYRRGSSYGTESSLKYYIIGSMGSGVLLLGVSEIYGATGSLVLEDIERVYMLGDVGGLGVLLLMSGLLLKLGVGGMHQWYIDVIDGGEIRVSRLISVLPKISVLIMLVKVTMLGVGIYLLWYLAVVSMVVGVIGGYYQRRVKRFIAYSSIGHVGYILMVVGSGEHLDGGVSIIEYLSLYGLMSLGVWQIIEINRVMYIEELGRLRGGMLGLSILVLMFSMSGLPPFYGFTVKLGLLDAVIGEGDYLLALTGMVCTVIGGYNYLRWIKVVYNERVEGEVFSVGKTSSILLSVVVCLCIILGLE